MTTGKLGVNLLYGCFFFNEDPKELLKSLYDNIECDHLEIDMVQMNGPAFEGVDNRILSLQLVKLGMTDAVIFTPDGVNIQEKHISYSRQLPPCYQGKHRYDCQGSQEVP